MTVDLNQAAAEAAVALFQRIAPDVVEVCEPFIYRLFAALQDGHTFIWLHDDEAAVLQEAAPLVARTGDAPLVLQGRRLFLGRIWQLERDLAREIVRLAKAALPVLNREQSRQNLADWFQETGSEGQQAAAALALLQPFMLISGLGRAKPQQLLNYWHYYVMLLLCCHALRWLRPQVKRLLIWRGLYIKPWRVLLCLKPLKRICKP